MRWRLFRRMSGIELCVVAAIAMGISSMAVSPMGVSSMGISSTVWAQDVGVRPYEMERAGRLENPVAPIVSFEGNGDGVLDGWTVVENNATGAFTTSQEQRLWGDYVGKVTYRVQERGKPTSVKIVPPAPIPIPDNSDSIQIWGYGNNWAWAPDAATPCTTILVHVKAADGTERTIQLGYVNWKEWFLMVKRFTPEEKTLFATGATFVGLEIAGGQNVEDRVLYFDDLGFYQEPKEPLSFDARPRRNLLPQSAMVVGNHVDPERVLPFPTREATILPVNDAAAVVTLEPAESEDSSWGYTYRLESQHLTIKWKYTGGKDSSDPTAIVCEYRVDGEEPVVFPFVEGGLLFDGKRPNSMTLIATERIENPPELVENRTDRATMAVRTTWKATVDETGETADEKVGETVGETVGEKAYDVVYTFTVLGKTLVCDVVVPEPGVTEVRFGKVAWTQPAENVSEPKVITVPFLTGDYNARPGVAVFDGERPIFVAGFADHTRSNASAFFFENSVKTADKTGETLVTYNGGTRYTARTDGTLNPCYERFFLTISDRFDEILPEIPNPQSPWIDVTGERIWIAHGASMNRENDYKTWKRFHRYGMEKILVTDHEVGWRDGGESFTFRTQAAPGKGGDENQAWYAKAVQDLGYRYGIYNNYTDFAPVNEFWSEDMVTRVPDGNLRGAWARCYNPKPAKSVEYEARLTPIIQEKFHLSTAYCDVHSAVRPWDYVDFDARVPGAGAFSCTFYNYGEIMLHQKRTWGPPTSAALNAPTTPHDSSANSPTTLRERSSESDATTLGGPVYSEGNNHWYYVGLTDGNYGQDQSYAGRIPNSAWLVDFDLRKMHPLGTSFGMGNPGMFYGDGVWGAFRDEVRVQMLDRFLAATLAFGHTGFFVTDSLPFAARSYFLLQQVQKRYIAQPVKSIQYRSDAGEWLETSAAIATDAYRRNQIRIEYAEGLTLFVNGNAAETLPLTAAETRSTESVLPPNGWFVWDPTGAVAAYRRNDTAGNPIDYVESSAYLYADGRGILTPFDRADGTPGIVCDGQLALIPRSDSWKNVAEKSPRVEMEAVDVRTATMFEVIPQNCHTVGVTTQGRDVVSVVAMNEEGEITGSVEYRCTERGLVYLTLQDGAASYLVTLGEPSKWVYEPVSAKRYAVAGETVAIARRPEGEEQERGREWTTVVPVDVADGTVCFVDCAAQAEDPSRELDYLIQPYAKITATLDSAPLTDADPVLVMDVANNLAPNMASVLTVAVSEKTSEKASGETSGEGTEAIPAAREKLCEELVASQENRVAIPAEYRVPGKEYTLSLMVRPENSESPIKWTTAEYTLRTENRLVEIVPWDWGAIEVRMLHFRNGRSVPIETLDQDTGATADRRTSACGGISKDALFTHPPYLGGTGAVSVALRPISLPPEVPVTIQAMVGKADGSDPGDGILYQIWVTDDQGERTKVGEQRVTKHEWLPIAADLSPWQGQTVRVEFLADVGEANNSSGDWACWADCSFKTTKPRAVTELIR